MPSDDPARDTENVGFNASETKQIEILVIFQENGGEPVLGVTLSKKRYINTGSL